MPLSPTPGLGPHLQTAPCLHLLELRFPFNDYYTAAKNGVEVSLPLRENSWLATTRRDYIVRRYPLSHAQFVLLQKLQSGETIGEAITAAASVYADSHDSLAADIQNWFRVWTAAPMFERVISD